MCLVSVESSRIEEPNHREVSGEKRVSFSLHPAPCYLRPARWRLPRTFYAGPNALAVISQVTGTEVPAGEAMIIQPRFADFPQTAQWALGGLSA